MTHRERLRAALNRSEPDRLPVDLGATATTTITRAPYLRLRAHLGLPELEPAVFSFTAGSVRPDEDVLEHFGVDTRSVKPGAGSGFKTAVGRDGAYDIYSDEWGNGFRRPRESGLYFDIVRHPLLGLDTASVRGYPFPQGGDPNRVAGLRGKALALREAGYPVILGQSFGTGILHGGTALFGFEDYFCRMILEPEIIDEVSERLLQGKMAFYENVFAEAGEFIDVIAEADDLGTQRGPFLSIEDYRKRIKPYQKRLFAFIKKRAPKVKIFYHSCGSVVDFIPDLIEIGIDALNPLQLSARGMDPLVLKREYGGDLCFWGGGVDTQEVLPHGRPGDVKKEVRRRLSAWMKGGGYVFAAVHNIQADVPPENVVALFEAVNEFRGL
jgi:uroporphyrinogen decarboxylase